MIASELQEEINRSNARNKISVKVVLFLFAAIVVASSCFGYWQYNQDYRSPGFSSAPRGWMAVVNGTAYAPQQYRIGVVLPAYWIARHTTLKISFVLALFDLVSGFVTVFLLYDLLQKSETYRRASATAQWFGVAAFALLMQYDVVWIQRYQRPETFPVAMLTASLFWIWTPPKHRQLKSSMERWGRVGGVLVVSLLLGLMRADTGFTLNAGALLVCILQPRKTLSWPRWLALAISLAGCLLSAGAQIYIMRVVYPQANYGDCAYSVEVGT